MKIAERVRMIEVGPRDGLQNEAAPVSIEAKVIFIEALVEAGITNVESGSFVSPRWVPQMADTAEVLKRIRRVDGVSYPVLVPNTKGMEAAIASGVSRQVAVYDLEVRRILVQADFKIQGRRFIGAAELGAPLDIKDAVGSGATNRGEDPKPGV